MLPGESVFILSGSLASVFGSIFILFCHVHLRIKDRVRTKLIFCLATADLFNSINNSASGFVAISGIPLTGPLCTLNGFVGQWTVVASDISVLAIAIATVSAITRPMDWYSKSSWIQRYVTFVIGAIWTYSLSTALIALFTVGYYQSAANWCWINKTPWYARYALTHILRMIIIVSIFIAYAWVYFFLKRLHNPSLPGAQTGTDTTQSERSDENGISAPPSSSTIRDQEKIEPNVPAMSSTEPFYVPQLKPSLSQRTIGLVRSRSSMSEGKNKRDPILKIMRLMIIFPVVYALLWLPGLVNRMYDVIMPEDAETPLVLEYLQGLTQYIGFANAVVYGLNEEILKAMRKKWRRSSAEPYASSRTLDSTLSRPSTDRSL